jgi:hypothetical protein
MKVHPVPTDDLPSLVRATFTAQFRALGDDLAHFQDRESLVGTGRRLQELIDRIIRTEIAFLQSECHSDRHPNSRSDHPCHPQKGPRDLCQ